MFKVSNMNTHGGNTAPNQFVIVTKKGRYFQSYDSMIAFKPNRGGTIQLGYDWDYSNITLKYLHKFLGTDSKREVQKRINAGEYTVVDLDEMEME